MKKVRKVIIESPYAGDIEKNLRYVRACMRDCLLRGEAPFASHALYTQDGVLRDEVPEERMHGITAGFAWRETAEATVVYTDLGTSKGMEYGIAHATELGHPIEYRQLGSDWDKFKVDPRIVAMIADRDSRTDYWGDDLVYLCLSDLNDPYYVDRWMPEHKEAFLLFQQLSDQDQEKTVRAALQEIQDAAKAKLRESK